MFKKKCRCGESEKNFMMDIGPFFIAECCEKAGFDEKGNKEGEPTQEEIKEGLERLEKESSPFESAPEVEGDLDKDGDVDKDDVEMASELEKMNQKQLQELCKERGIEFKKNESKAKLREKLK